MRGVEPIIACLLALAGGVLGSQAPGFTLQYMQNLQGQIDALQAVVERFDASIAAFGYTRDRALEECAAATGLLHALCDTYLAEIERHALLAAHLAELAAAEAATRPLILAQEEMRDVTLSTLKQFEPAMPVTVEGLIYFGIGGLAGLSGFWLLRGAASLLLGRLRQRLRP